MNPIIGLKLRGNYVGPGIKQDGWRTECAPPEVRLP